MTLADERESCTQGIALNSITEANCIDHMADLPDNSIHAIISDIPYGIGVEDWDVLHSNSNTAYRGASPAQTRAGAVFKSRGKPINGWSVADRRIPQEYYTWCRQWAPSWFRVLKPGGSVFVFAGRRLQHRCVAALEDAGLSYKDQISWLRPRAVHRAQRVSVVFERRGDAESASEWSGWRVGNLRPTFEPISWLTKPYKIGTTIADNVLAHGVGAYNEAGYTDYAGSPDNVLKIGLAKGEGGLHPTQKPTRLMEALIELVTKPGQTVLDPFAGSGSTLVAAKRLNRNYLGYELDPGYVEVCRRRLAEDVPPASRLPLE